MKNIVDCSHREVVEIFTAEGYTVQDLKVFPEGYAHVKLALYSQSDQAFQQKEHDVDWMKDITAKLEDLAERKFADISINNFDVEKEEITVTIAGIRE
jgi:hypothetical protein